MSTASAVQVVVVNDEKPLVELICQVLQSANITAEGCTIGSHAFECIRMKRPQVTILDLMMPETDGLTLFHQLRADPVTAAIPVIFATVNVEHIAKKLGDENDQHILLLRKPFSIDELLDAVSHALEVTERTP